MEKELTHRLVLIEQAIAALAIATGKQEAVIAAVEARQAALQPAAPASEVQLNLIVALLRDAQGTPLRVSGTGQG